MNKRDLFMFFGHGPGRLAGWICLLLLFGILSLGAQDAGQTLRPRSPVLPRMPELSEWTVIYRYSRDKARERFVQPEKNDLEEAADDQDSEGDEPVTFFPKSRTVTKHGKVYREVTRWSNGKVTEKWIVDDMQLMEVPQSDDLMRIGRSGYPPDMSDYSRSDFEEMEWVGMDNYKGVRSVRGGQAFEFSTAAADRRLTPREKSNRYSDEGYKKMAEIEEPPPYTAYLDVRTQRPLLLDNGRYVQIYRYSNQPPAPLVVPEKFVEEFRQWKNEIAAKNIPPPPP